jgi:hypothetical protein
MDKYNIDSNCLNNILTLKLCNLPKFSIDTCLILDNNTTIIPYIDCIKCNKYLVIVNYAKGFSFNNYDDLAKNSKILLYNNYNVTGINIGIYYIKKINYSIFKKLSNIEDNTYISMMSKNKIEKNILVNIIEPYIKNTLIISSKFYNYLNLPNYKIYSKHIFNLHQLFDRYLYVETGCVDQSPRLPYESDYYNKEILYINNKNVSKYFDIFTKIDRNLTVDDIVIKEFLK